MSTNITSNNSVVEAIITGTAPRPARLAAANGLLPLSQIELLEVLVALRQSRDAEIAEAANETLSSQTPEDLLVAAKAGETSPAVLAYLGTITDSPRDVHEALILNNQTPDLTIASLATALQEGALLELISANQQRLVRTPDIIEAILENPARTAEAERRAKETRREFFEKERGARQIADELRARGNTAAAEFFETAELTTVTGELSIEDAWIIAQHIEVSDADIDESWLPAERYEELVSESVAEHAAAVQRIIDNERRESGDVSAERVSLIRRIMFMNAKDRMKLAMKGDREARSILIRDSNRVVATAVINNPRVTEQEVENIAAMRTVADEVLRLIARNRAWARSYTIIHNLARNPRTPIPTIIGILPRIRTKDLQHLSQNRNVSEAARRQALRLAQTRAGE
ncbi:MAG TPA: hypothetical protein VJ124_06040 [Pyrinomonadaceae bacterium]|nr:hypothetical protein [Pyrinomonadaceae bacterium]